MTSDSVPKGHDEPDQPPDPVSDQAVDDTVESEVRAALRTRRRRWGIAISGLVAIAILAAMFLVELPYYVVSPGSVRPSEQRIHISGTDSFETPGRVMFTTVYSNRATPALMVRAWLDDAVVVRTEAEMYPNGDRLRARRENVALMDISKIVATKVALDELGIPAEFDGNGAQVTSVVDGSPSKGILKPGDVITEVDGGEIAIADDIGDELADNKPGDTVDVVIERPSRSSDKFTEEQVKVTLGAAGTDSRGDPNRPILGIQVQTYGLGVASEVQIEVDSGEVTGPSAGLAWTLAILDRLTPGSLTGKKDIAVTGEIRSDGTVAPIGGITQKVSAVKRAGLKVFVYPSETPKEEQAAMRKVAGGDVSLHPVANIEEAVKVLDPDGLGRP